MAPQALTQGSSWPILVTDPTRPPLPTLLHPRILISSRCAFVLFIAAAALFVFKESSSLPPPGFNPHPPGSTPWIHPLDPPSVPLAQLVGIPMKSLRLFYGVQRCRAENQDLGHLPGILPLHLHQQSTRRIFKNPWTRLGITENPKRRPSIRGIFKTIWKASRNPWPSLGSPEKSKASSEIPGNLSKSLETPKHP